MSIAWQKRIVWTVYTILILSMIASLCSCNQKTWTKRGTKKGWIDTTKVKENNFALAPNEAAGDSVIDDFADSISLDIKLQFGKDLSPETKEKIKWRTKKEFIPKYIKTVYPDTTLNFPDGSSIKLWFDSTGTIHGTPKYKQQVIKTCDTSIWDDWPYWLIIGILFLLLWLTRRK